MQKTSWLALVLLLGLFVIPSPPAADADEAKWRQKLSRGDAGDHYPVIVSAGERKDPSAAMVLLEYAVKAKYPHLAVACGDALAAMEWPGEDRKAKAAFEKWIKRIVKAKEETPLQNLARLLGAWGDPIVDPHLAHVASGRRPPRVQAEALMMCSTLVPTKETPFKKVKEVVKKALKGRSDEIKAAACAAAARLGDKTFFDPLMSIVKKDHGEYAGLYAVFALQRIGYDQGIDSFLHALGANPKKETRQANLKAITELSTKNDLEALLSLTKHKKQEFRDAAAIALGRLAWRGAYGEKVVTGEGKSKSKMPDVPKEVIDRMISMVETESAYEARDAARQALIRFGDAAWPAVRDRLPGSVDFAEEDLRLTAMELCGLAGAEDAYKKIVKTAVHDKSLTIRMFAARALEGIRPKDAVEELTGIASSAGQKKTRSYELNAVRALGYIRDMSALEALLGLIESHYDNETLMREVEYAMERLTGHRFGRKPDRWRKWIEKSTHPLHPMIAKFDRDKNRQEASEKGLYGLSSETERAVENGLRWLELQQHPVGLWDGNDKAFAGVVGCEPAYTGLCLLAYLGAGYKAHTGKYREAVRRASDFLAATQFYDGGFPVTGGGDDSWIYAYLIAMGVWGITESYALSGRDDLEGPAQWGIDYLVRVQTPGAGWRYGPRYVQSDTSCTSWVLMTLKSGDLVNLHVAQRSLDGIDSWLERCSYDITGEEEIPADLATDYDYEVGSRRYFKAFTGYFELSGKEKSAAQQTSMTAVGMVCRFFMGWKRSHPYMIGCGNYLMDYLPRWMKGLEKGMAIAWYHYYWYYGTLAMHQMGGRYWRAWNDKIKLMYPEKQRLSPPDLHGSWDPDTALLNGGRLFSTAMSIMALETYYRFSPLLGN